MIYAILSVVCFSLSLLCEWAERKSRLWYQDRIMIRLSGFFCALGWVYGGLAFFL